MHKLLTLLKVDLLGHNFEKKKGDFLQILTPNPIQSLSFSFQNVLLSSDVLKCHSRKFNSITPHFTSNHRVSWSSMPEKFHSFLLNWC